MSLFAVLHRNLGAAIGGCALVLGAASACSDSPSEPEAPLLTAEEVTFAPELGINLSAMTRLPQGIYWQDVEEGSPENIQLVPFLDVFVHYDAWLSDGTQFAENEPQRFLLSTGDAISAWDLGMIGMYVGGTRRLVVPPASGYAHFTTGGIPGNSVTVYDVQVDSVRIPL